jgi:hypothetical protein
MAETLWSRKYSNMCAVDSAFLQTLTCGHQKLEVSLDDVLPYGGPHAGLLVHHCTELDQRWGRAMCWCMRAATYRKARPLQVDTRDPYCGSK